MRRLGGGVGTSRRGEPVRFATSNEGKFREAREILSQYGITLVQYPTERLEIQSDSLEEIARRSVIEAWKEVGKPVVVEDAGLFIEALNGFPGPYSSYVYKTIGLNGILKLMEGVYMRHAKFLSAVAYMDADLTEPVCFVGEVRGRISHRIRGYKGFGFDPIFIPDEGDGRTFGEMETWEKNRLSHRSRAFKKLGEWLSSR